MTYIKDKQFDEERALYGSKDITVDNCKFDGPADGESAFKESSNVEVRDSFFNLRYPFWHDNVLKIDGCEMTENCRAALWYTNDAGISNSKLHGIKALRECSDVKIQNCDIVSPEFGWSVKNIDMKDTDVVSEYFMMRSDRLNFDNVTLKGKYSFQYITDSVFDNCNFDTKDAFWHANNVVIKNSVIKGEYLAWYCENVTFENCTLIGTQPLCYCKNLKLINCKMVDTDLAFEKSEVEATITSSVISIKNPMKGKIVVQDVSEIIMDDENAKGVVVISDEK
ncbi:DUF3737 family protein [Lachnobacterium bovis]|uniref:DUF3737 domain-containing protein n=1 Tax=Lachnobacterium bovis DSM 14045 TaxID=1122142 RepID=A0A1H3L423_9FIRM|nr:DUF3737 family protein [Lachnobacterium bovis]SDY59163.1 Protein of unknown function [Lachnobacterium bovis DSM 14045]